MNGQHHHDKRREGQFGNSGCQGFQHHAERTQLQAYDSCCQRSHPSPQGPVLIPRNRPIDQRIGDERWKEPQIKDIASQGQ